MVQNPPYWSTSSLLFPHWDVKTKRPQPVKLDWPLFLCPSAGIIISLPSNMADFVPCHRLLQKAYSTILAFNPRHKTNSSVCCAAVFPICRLASAFFFLFTIFPADLFVKHPFRQIFANLPCRRDGTVAKALTFQHRLSMIFSRHHMWVQCFGR